MSEEFILTRASLKKKHQEREIKVTSYSSHKPEKKQSNKKKQVLEISNKSLTTNEINVKRAKFEIIKLGMSGFNTQRKEEAKVQLAVKLGAKPPTSKYKNYKQLLRERKKQKNYEEKKKLFQQKGKNFAKFAKSRTNIKYHNKKQNIEKGILNIYGKVKLAEGKT